jgi:hypothetical protein
VCDIAATSPQAWRGQVMMGRPLNSFEFLRGILEEPPRAGMIATTSAGMVSP